MISGDLKYDGVKSIFFWIVVWTELSDSDSTLAIILINADDDILRGLNCIF